jgi:hypothetical protein
MKRRVVENWLTKAGELSFTVPFCQLLVSEGKRVIHISSQGPLEQGKAAAWSPTSPAKPTTF